MLRSMTGYARKSGSSLLGNFVIEIHSVNRKGLDLSVFLPKEFLCFDVDVRKWVSSALERGQVTLRCTLIDFTIAGQSCFKSSKEKWEGICIELGIDPSQVTLPFLLAHTPTILTFTSDQEASLRNALEGVINQVLQELIGMKEQEARFLEKDFQARLSQIEEELVKVESFGQVPLISYEKKIKEKLEELNLFDEDGKNRLMREVALLAEKLDVHEEIVRLKAHVHQFQECLTSPVSSKGRVLEFITQEMVREVNTIGSKLQVTEVSKAVIRMKSELEKIREQVQNIE